MGKIGSVITVVESTGDIAIAVASAGTVYTRSFPIRSLEFFGIWMQLASDSGTPDVKVEVEQSYTAPATEGSADGNWVVPEGISDIFTQIQGTTAKVKTLALAPMPLARFKITGLGSNPASTTASIKVFTQSDV